MELERVFESRNYQRCIIERCVEKNSIVYLPTGAGKTYIAIQVIKHFSRDLEKKYSEGGKRSIFLVNTVCLAKQQSECIQSQLHLNVELLIGEKNVDHWNMNDWMKILDENEILVATADVISDAIDHSFIDLEQVNLLIFDECHHGRKDHAYARIMKRMSPQNKTRIVGLSGMLIGMDGKIRVDKVDEELKNLEAMFLSTIVTVDSMEDLEHVISCSTDATEGFVSFRPTEESLVIAQVHLKIQEIKSILNSVQFKKYVTINPKTLRQTDSKKIKTLIKCVEDFGYHVKHLGSFGGYLSLLSSIIQMEITKRFSETNEYREIVKMCITKIEQSTKFLKNQLDFSSHDVQIIQNNSSDKILRLLILLRKTFTEQDRKKDLQAIIFVKRRSTAKIIYHILNAIKTAEPDFPVLADFVVGVNDQLPESIECIVNASYTNLAIEKFKNKETNLIISTSVLEEGIDLQMCNLVIHFDSPNTFREYVQSRGRARVDDSNYVVFIEENQKEKFRDRVKDWRSVSDKLNNNLMLKTYDRVAPSEDRIEDQRLDLWEPFITPISKSKLGSNNAVTTLENYASKLPKDLFTVSNLSWGRQDIEGSVRAFVQMPSSSKVKGKIHSDPQANVKIAKRHAAFKACIALYEAGELDDHLVPVDATSKIEEYNDDYFEHWKEYATDTKKAGTKKNKRVHDIKKPDVWQDSNPRVGKVNYLHCIKVTPLFNPTNEADAVFKELYGNDNTYGILTSKKMPKICKIRLFESFGELEIEISAPPVVIEITTEAQMKQLKNFHVTVFQDILAIWKNFMAFDNSSFIIVPLINYSRINWELVNFAQRVEAPNDRMKYDEIMRTDFSRDAYDRMTICPIYRSLDPYIVVHYAEHLTPLSPFPNDDYENYRDYYSQQYGVTIINTQQNLLAVKGVGKELNLFFPGCGVLGKKKSYERNYQKEFFVAELCHNYKIPGDYRLKAKLIPAVVHRIHYLLLAEELRRWLMNNGIGNTSFKEQIYQLDVDYKDYDAREMLIMNELNNRPSLVDEEMRKKFLDFLRQQMTHSKGLLHEAKAKALLWFEKSELPIDIDRNWLTLKEVDIDYYYRFLNKNENFSSKLIHKKMVVSPMRQNLFLTDCPDRMKINLLALDESSNCLQQKDLIKVLTTANAADVFDMERPEVLGDAFLKFSVSIYLYKKHAEWHEGYLTSMKGKIVSNRNLFYIGNNFGLSKMIKSSKYEAKNSFPPASKLPNNLKTLMNNNKYLLKKLYDVQEPAREDILAGNDAAFVVKHGNSKEDCGNDEDYSDDCSLVFIDKHAVGDKIIADGVEALIGTVVGSLGIDSGLKILTSLKILPDDKFIKNLLTEKIQPRNIYNDDTRMPFIGKLEKIIGYKFKNPIFLIQAVTHPSCSIKTCGTYQQLEFVGDAVLDFLITSYIIERCPQMDPGDLTDLRSALVNNATLACIVVKNEIQKFLQFENIKLTESIDKFVEFQKANEYQVALDQIALMETEDENCVADAVDIPKVIGDLFESIVGAVLLDSGMDLQITWKIIYNLMEKELHEFMNKVPKQIVRQLYEYDGGSADPKFTEAFFLEEYGMTTVGVEVTVDRKRELFCGIGVNKILAKKCAAKMAVKALTAKP